MNITALSIIPFYLYDFHVTIHTGNNDKLFGEFSNNLFLELTSTTSLDSIQLLIDFVSTVNGHVNFRESFDIVESASIHLVNGPISTHTHLLLGRAQSKATINDQVFALETGRDIDDVFEFRTLQDTFNSIDHSGAGSNTDDLVVGGNVFINSLVGSELFAVFNCVGCHSREKTCNPQHGKSRLGFCAWRLEYPRSILVLGDCLVSSSCCCCRIMVHLPGLWLEQHLYLYPRFKHYIYPTL